MKSSKRAWTGIGINYGTGSARGSTCTPRFASTRPCGRCLTQFRAEARTQPSRRSASHSEPERAVDFTQPYCASGLAVAIAANRQIDWLAILRNVLTLRFVEAVAILIASAIVTGSVIWLIEARHTAHFSLRRQRPRYRSLVVRLGDDPGGGRQGAGDFIGTSSGIMWMISSIIIIAGFQLHRRLDVAIGRAAPGRRGEKLGRSFRRSNRKRQFNQRYRDSRERAF
jgi:hypothetical protein